MDERITKNCNPLLPTSSIPSRDESWLEKTARMRQSKMYQLGKIHPMTQEVGHNRIHASLISQAEDRTTL